MVDEFHRHGFKMWLLCNEMATLKRFPSEQRFPPTTTVICNALAGVEQFCDAATETTIMTDVAFRSIGYNKFVVLVWAFTLPPPNRPFLLVVGVLDVFRVGGWWMGLWNC